MTWQGKIKCTTDFDRPNVSRPQGLSGKKPATSWLETLKNFTATRVQWWPHYHLLLRENGRKMFGYGWTVHSVCWPPRRSFLLLFLQNQAWVILYNYYFYCNMSHGRQQPVEFDLLYDAITMMTSLWAQVNRSEGSPIWVRYNHEDRSYVHDWGLIKKPLWTWVSMRQWNGNNHNRINKGQKIDLTMTGWLTGGLWEAEVLVLGITVTGCLTTWIGIRRNPELELDVCGRGWRNSESKSDHIGSAGMDCTIMYLWRRGTNREIFVSSITNGREC